MKNYYDIIGVSQNASFSEIKKEYLRKIKQYHPDLYKGDKTFAEQKTAELNEAYNVLKDTHKRQEYDILNVSEKEIPQKRVAKKGKNKIKIFFKKLLNKIKLCFSNLKINKNTSSKVENTKENKDKLKLNIIIIIESIIILILILVLII